MNENNGAKQAIEQGRARIDECDEKIVALLNERSHESLAIRKVKLESGMDVYDPGREGRIFERLSKLNGGPMSDDNLDEIYRTILKVMKEVQLS